MSETSKKIIETIHERHITHRPKWYFFIRNAFVWAALVGSVFLGALSFSIEETVIEKGIGLSWFPGIPLLWVACTALFVVLAFLNLRLTKEGYRYRAVWIILGLLLVVATFALLFGREGIGERAESVMERASFYHVAGEQ